MYLQFYLKLSMHHDNFCLVESSIPLTKKTLSVLLLASYRGLDFRLNRCILMQVPKNVVSISLQSMELRLIYFSSSRQTGLSLLPQERGLLSDMRHSVVLHIHAFMAGATLPQRERCILLDQQQEAMHDRHCPLGECMMPFMYSLQHWYK